MHVESEFELALPSSSFLVVLGFFLTVIAPVSRV